MLTLLVLLILVGGWLRSQEWSDPWAGKHRAWGGAVYANMARNLIRYEIADTRLGLIASTGVVEPEEFEFYYHHPPLNVWAMALSFRAFGVSEWSARLMPLAASILGIALLYGLAAELYSRRAALAAAALLAFAPGETYYADHVDPYGSLGLFCTLLAVFGYARFLRTERTRDLAVCIAGVSAGCLTTWTPYFAVPLLLAHAALSTPRSQWRERAGLLALPLCAVAAFALFVAHRQLLLGSAGGEADGELYGSLIQKLAARGAWASWFGVESASVADGWRQHGWDTWSLLTPLPIVLFGAWAFDLARRGFAGGLVARDGIAGILIAYGLLHSLAFPGTLHGHDFLARCYSAGLALTGGVVLAGAFDGLREKRGVLTALVCAGAALGLWLVLALPRLAELRVRRWNPALNVERAQAIRLATEEDTRVLLALRSDRVFQYYIDRPVEFETVSPERLKALAGEGRDAVWIVPPNRARAAARALQGVSYSREAVAGLVLHRLESGR